MFDRPYREKPPFQFARVNLAHDLADQIAAFLLPAANRTMYDACTGVAEGTGSSQSVVATGEGMALRCDGTARTSGTAFLNARGANAQRSTTIARMRLRTAPASNAAAMTYGTSGRGSHVGFNSSGNALGGSSGTNGIFYGSDSTNWLNTWVTVGGSAAYGAAFALPGNVTGRVWVNGVRRTDSSASGGYGADVTPTNVYIGREPLNYNSFYTGDIAWAILFNRMLLDDEHKAIAENPFQILEQTGVRRYYFAQSTAAPTTAIIPIIDGYMRRRRAA